MFIAPTGQHLRVFQENQCVAPTTRHLLHCTVANVLVPPVCVCVCVCVCVRVHVYECTQNHISLEGCYASLGDSYMKASQAANLTTTVEPLLKRTPLQ